MAASRTFELPAYSRDCQKYVESVPNQNVILTTAVEERDVVR